MTTSPRIGFTNVEEGEGEASVTVNQATWLIEQYAQIIVLDRTTTVPAGTEVDGDAYLVGSPATGAFATHENEFACKINGSWDFFASRRGLLAYVIAENAYIRCDAALAWHLIPSLTAPAERHTLCAAGVVWAAMAAGPAEFRGLIENRKIVDFTDRSQIRISSSCMGAVLGPASSTLRLQYSIDGGTTWFYFDAAGANAGPSVAIDVVGCQSGAWVTIDAAAKTSTTQVRMVGVGGTGTNPRFSMLEFEIR